MAVLGDAITVRDRFARSANLERDMARPEPLEGYVPTARGLDVIERVTTVASRGTAGGAWSVTGPYGSGKSSLGLLLDAALGGESPLRQASMQLIGDASAPAAELLKRAHSRHGTEMQGFHRAVVTATREPLAVTVTRALHSAVCRVGAPPPRGIGLLMPAS